MNKQPEMPKKLSLKKSKIVSLTKAQMATIKGGGLTTLLPTKGTNSGVDCTGRYGM